MTDAMLNLLRQKQFDQVARAYSGELYRFAFWLCRDRFVAEDLVQETFSRAWKNWDALLDRDNPKPWLITILRNEHARLYERKQLDYVDVDPEELNIAADHVPLDLYEIENLVGSLPLSLREPFVLQVLGGFSCQEIAEQLGTTEGAIMVRLTRARQTLRNSFSEQQTPSRARKQS